MEPPSQTVADTLTARFGLRNVRVLRMTGESSAESGAEEPGDIQLAAASEKTPATGPAVD